MLAKFKRTLSIFIFDAGREIYDEESKLIYIENKGMTQDAKARAVEQWNRR
jgi:hypothetical protein